MTKWKQLAPRPYSSLWLWCAANKSCTNLQLSPGKFWFREANSEPYIFSVVNKKQPTAQDCFPAEFVSHGSDSESDMNEDQSNQPDWLDVSIASVDQNESLRNCLIQSVKVPHSVDHSETSGHSSDQGEEGSCDYSDSVSKQIT